MCLSRRGLCGGSQGLHGGAVHDHLRAKMSLSRRALSSACHSLRMPHPPPLLPAGPAAAETKKQTQKLTYTDTCKIYGHRLLAPSRPPTAPSCWMEEGLVEANWTAQRTAGCPLYGHERAAAIAMHTCAGEEGLEGLVLLAKNNVGGRPGPVPIESDMPCTSTGHVGGRNQGGQHRGLGRTRRRKCAIARA